MTDSSTYRGQRKRASAKRFLCGEARRAYVLRDDILCGLEEREGTGSEADESTDCSCSCRDTLGPFTAEFGRMVHTGRELARTVSSQSTETKGASKDIGQGRMRGCWRMSSIHMETMLSASPVSNAFLESAGGDFIVCVKSSGSRLVPPR